MDHISEEVIQESHDIILGDKIKIKRKSRHIKMMGETKAKKKKNSAWRRNPFMQNENNQINIWIFH